MKLINLINNSESFLRFSHREMVVEAEFQEEELTFTFGSDGMREGKRILEYKEVQTFLSALKTFFTDSNHGKKFNYNSSSFNNSDLPQLRISTTNWGEP